MGTWPLLQRPVTEREGYAYESPLPSASPADQGEPSHCALASEESTKTMAKPHAWAELVHPLLHQQHRAIQRLGRISPAPFATFSSEDFPDFPVQGRRLQSLVTRPKWAIFHVDGKKHSWNKGPNPPGKLKFLLQSMGLVRASLLAGYPDFFFFWCRHTSAFSPDPDH